MDMPDNLLERGIFLPPRISDIHFCPSNIVLTLTTGDMLGLPMEQSIGNDTTDENLVVSCSGEP